MRRAAVAQSWTVKVSDLGADAWQRVEANCEAEVPESILHPNAIARDSALLEVDAAICIALEHVVVGTLAPQSRDAEQGAGRTASARRRSSSCGAVAQLLGDEDWHVRRMAVEAIGRMGEAAAAHVGAVAQLLCDEYEPVRRGAVEALAGMHIGTMRRMLPHAGGKGLLELTAGAWRMAAAPGEALDLFGLRRSASPRRDTRLPLAAASAGSHLLTVAVTYCRPASSLCQAIGEISFASDHADGSQARAAGEHTVGDPLADSRHRDADGSGIADNRAAGNCVEPSIARVTRTVLQPAVVPEPLAARALQKVSRSAIGPEPSISSAGAVCVKGHADRVKESLHESMRRFRGGIGTVHECAHQWIIVAISSSGEAVVVPDPLCKSGRSMFVFMQRCKCEA